MRTHKVVVVLLLFVCILPFPVADGFGIGQLTFLRCTHQVVAEYFFPFVIKNFRA